MKLTTIIATATTAAVLGTAGVSIAGASTGSDRPATTTVASTSGSPKSTTDATTNRAGRRARLRRLARHAFDLAAKTIGITPKALLQEVRSGKTIADVATEHNVQPQTVIDAIVNAATKKIEAAEAAGKISATRAAKLEQRLPTVVAKFVNTWQPKAKA